MKSFLRALFTMVMMLAVLSGLLSGCADNSTGEEKMIFSDGSELADYAQNTYWVSQPQYANSEHFILCCFTEDRCIKFDLSRNPEESLEDMFTQMLQQIQQSGDPLDYKDVYDFLESHPSVDALEYTAEIIQYNPSEGSASSISDTSVWKFYKNETMKHHGDSYVQSNHLLILEYAFNAAYKTVIELAQEAFLNQYPNAVSYKDVKYDPFSYLGENFIITGTAELDDYYNYEYRDFEYSYFCIAVEPIGGSYSDRWYIYANRSAFQELFQMLKNGKVSTITLVCQGQFVDATKNSLATLTDYFIS